jgi:hypothetical protein
MNSIEQNLLQARAGLLEAQAMLADLRRIRSPSTKYAEIVVCNWIDRAWEAQCMAQGSL